MVKLIKYIGPFLLLLTALTACNDAQEQLQETIHTDIKINYTIPGMDPWSVVTKADNKDEEEKKITSLQLFIFDNDGKPLRANQSALEQWYQRSETGSFIIDKDLFNTVQSRNQAKICLFANGIDLSAITSYQELQETVVAFQTLAIPENGLPMYGETIQDLTLNTQNGRLITIDLRALVARIDFDIKVVPSNTAGPFEPYFILNNYDICNLPNQVMITEPVAETTFKGERDIVNLPSPSDHEIKLGSESVRFQFYMPEHKRITNGWNDYPDNIDENSKQRFKPKLAKEDAAYLTLRGFFRDHQGRTHTVSYKVYLGANHTNDFNIFRNKQYKNNITIKDITNHDSDTEGISVDHRVNVTNDKFIVSIERETKLDAHIEVRPLDIHMADEMGKVQVSIVDPEHNDWFRLEHTLQSGGQYCSEGAHKGKRRYFTTNLVTETLAHSTEAIIESKTKNRIWLYFDENLYASKNGTRNGKIKLDFYNSKTDPTPTKTEYYTFIQHDLYPVEYKGRTYFIEYNEEYLYNFDPKDGYGDTTDGMAWGLENVQISDTDQAYHVDTVDHKGWAKKDLIDAINHLAPYYDFNDPLKGQHYSRKIYAKTSSKILSLGEAPGSAIEYCYNKNKRTDKGEINSPDWYMPSIGEIEDICMGAYSAFSVFQNKYYWASQPAYESNYYKAYKNNLNGLAFKGEYKNDNKKNARATKVVYDNVGYNIANSGYHTINSGESGINYKTTIFFNPGHGVTSSKTEFVNQNVVKDPGNMKRTDINRVRAVRRNDNRIILR